MISHWDEAETVRAELGHLGASWTDLAAAAGASRLGVNPIQVDPGRWSTPAHIESAQEEIFYVLSGSGWSWQQLGAEGDVRMHEVRAGDCIVHLGVPAGSVRTGLVHRRVPPGELNNVPHCHSPEEEIFVVLDGAGTLELTPSPTLADQGREPEQHAVRQGDVVSRPASTRISHAFRAGEGGGLLLQYGQRRANDITYYPRSNKIDFRGVGVIARLDHLGWETGEESRT